MAIKVRLEGFNEFQSAQGNPKRNYEDIGIARGYQRVKGVTLE